MSSPDNPAYREHRFLHSKPLPNWTFVAECLCGAQFTSQRTASDAHDKVRRHVKRMAERAEDAAWLEGIQHGHSR